MTELFKSRIRQALAPYYEENGRVLYERFALRYEYYGEYTFATPYTTYTELNERLQEMDFTGIHQRNVDAIRALTDFKICLRNTIPIIVLFAWGFTSVFPPRLPREWLVKFEEVFCPYLKSEFLDEVLISAHYGNLGFTFIELPNRVFLPAEALHWEGLKLAHFFDEKAALRVLDSASPERKKRILRHLMHDPGRVTTFNMFFDRINSTELEETVQYVKSEGLATHQNFEFIKTYFDKWGVEVPKCDLVNGILGTYHTAFMRRYSRAVMDYLIQGDDDTDLKLSEVIHMTRGIVTALPDPLEV